MPLTDAPGKARALLEDGDTLWLGWCARWPARALACV